MIGRAIERALAGKEDLEIEYRLSATDGAPRWIATRGRAEFDAAGKADIDAWRLHRHHGTAAGRGGGA